MDHFKYTTYSYNFLFHRMWNIQRTQSDPKHRQLFQILVKLTFFSHYVHRIKWSFPTRSEVPSAILKTSQKRILWYSTHAKSIPGHQPAYEWPGRDDSVRTVKDIDQWHMCEDEEVKAGIEAAVLQPRHFIKYLAIVKMAVHSGHMGGRDQTTDGISKWFVGSGLIQEKKGSGGRWRSRKEKTG